MGMLVADRGRFAVSISKFHCFRDVEGAVPYNTDGTLVADAAEKPRGYSRLASANSLPAFSFDERCAKEKAIKKKTLIHGASPQTPRAFEKARQNFSTWVRANKVLAKSQFGVCSSGMRLLFQKSEKTRF
mgnify:CR=1 FL=1